MRNYLHDVREEMALLFSKVHELCEKFEIELGQSVSSKQQR